MGSNLGGKIRIIARIKGNLNKDGEFFNGVLNSKPWISVSRPELSPNPNLKSSRVKISFGSDQISTPSGKQSYEVDECYEQDVNNEKIFDREVKPMISGLFGGQNSTVFAYGPRGSGKTYTIQGCEEEFGLAVLTVNEILPLAQEQGKIITISVFEVYQDRVSDLLDPNKPEVSVFDDGQGKIKLKGLSKVKVNSTSEFQSLYMQATNTRKQSHKITNEPLQRSHIGCIVHVVSPQTEKSKNQLVGKINFIDLASYEDSRIKSSDGSNLMEATRINKSLYAVHNVLYALNAKEARVPYRESKLTRTLQDSLGGQSRVLMVTCMNPSFCPETIQTISLSSRSCMAGFLASLDPGKTSRSGTKTTGNSSPQILTSASKFNVRSSMMSPKTVKPLSASASGKKQTGSKLHMSMIKAKYAYVNVKSRKLFDDTNLSKKSEEATLCPKSVSASMESSAQKEVIYQANEVANDSSTQPEVKCQISASLETDSSQHPSEEGQSILDGSLNMDSSRPPSDKDVLPNENSIILATPLPYQTPPPTGNFLIEDKENKGSLPDQSPPLSARIREISNNLKSLLVSTETNLKKAQESTNLKFEQVIRENMEPETPKSLQIVRADDKRVIRSNSDFKTPVERYELGASPWENFHMSGSRVKDSLVQEYLKFLNTASKEELKGLKGIGEKRATYILEMRDESPEPFKELDDLKDIGLSGKQIKGMMKSVAEGFFA